MKKTSIIYLCLLAYLIIPLGVYAQQENKTNYNLSEAIEYALIHNRKVKNADLNIQAAEKQKWETIATGLPQIDAKLAYQRWLKQQFPGVDFNRDGVVDFGAKQNITPSVTLTQLIFDGTYLVGLQSSKVFLEISNNAKLKTDKEIEKAVISAYSNLLLTQESIGVLEKNITNLNSNIHEIKALFKNGFVEEEDIEQLQLTLNGLNNNLENLNSLKNISKNLLKLLMGYNTNHSIEITDDLNQLSKDISLINLAKENLSVFNNIDYKIAQNNTEAKRLLYKLEISRKLPSIGGFITGNYIGNSNNFTFLKKSQSWIPTSLMGININIPIFSSFKSSARMKRAKIDWDISKNKLADIQEELAIKIESTKTELQLAVNTLENKKKNLALAERIERKNNIKYTEGIASSFELRQAQIQLYSSQQEYLQAMVNVINKKAALNALKN